MCPASIFQIRELDPDLPPKTETNRNSPLQLDAGIRSSDSAFQTVFLNNPVLTAARPPAPDVKPIDCSRYHVTHTMTTTTSKKASKDEQPAHYTVDDATIVNLNSIRTPHLTTSSITKSRKHQESLSKKRSSLLRVTDGEQHAKRRKRLWCDIVEELALRNGIETDAHRIAQRQRQIDFGKNTLAYDRFIGLCPRHSRQRDDPMTPLPNQKCSKRSFVGQIIAWRKKVYQYIDDLDNKAQSDRNSATDLDKDDIPDDSDNQDDDDDDGEGGLAHMAGLDTMDIDMSDDLDDIELDGQGNVIEKKDCAKQSKKDNEKSSKKASKQGDKKKETEKSVFDDF